MKIILLVMLLFLCGCTQTQAQTDNVTALKNNIEAQDRMIASLYKQIGEQTLEIKSLNNQLLICNGKPAQLKKFDSIEQLTAFLFNDTTDQIPRTGTFDCEDYAMALCTNAFNQGYFIGITGDKSHASNFAIIGNTIYGIEPQSDRVSFLGVLD